MSEIQPLTAEQQEQLLQRLSKWRGELATELGISGEQVDAAIQQHLQQQGDQQHLASKYGSGAKPEASQSQLEAE